MLARSDSTQVYVYSLCILSVVLENQPDLAICDAADRAEMELPIPVAH